MPKNREKQKFNKKLEQIEKFLNEESEKMESRMGMKNEFSIKDLTPYNMGRTENGMEIVYR